MRFDLTHPPLTKISSRARRALLLRSLLIQGSWNYATLIGTGFAYSLLPALEEIYQGDEEGLDDAIERHCQLFNSHPYLVTLALGAVTRLEGRAATDSSGGGFQMIERYKAAIRGALGAFGDRLVWTGWRPLCLLATLTALLLGAPWWLAAVGFLIVYNLGHLYLRVWGLRVGLDDPMGIAAQLRTPRLERAQRALTIGATFIIGLMIPLIAIGLPSLSWGDSSERIEVVALLPLGIVGAILGVRWGTRMRESIAIALMIGALIVTLIGMIR